MALALRSPPAGTGYAVWVGIGAVGVGRAVVMVMGIVGIVGLRLVEG